MFVKELRELLEVLGRIAAALEQLAEDSRAARRPHTKTAGDYLYAEVARQTTTPKEAPHGAR